MISGLREAVKESILLKGLLGLMMISFGVWGVGDFIGTGGLDPSIAIKIGPKEITTNEFQRRFDQELTRFKEEVGPEAARNMGLKRSIANAMIQDITQTATVSAAAQDMGIVIPIQRLQSSLIKEEAFQNSTGTFDQSRFSDVLYQNNLSESQFLDLFASDLRHATIIAPVIANAGAPDYLVKNLFTYQNETRVADTLLVTVSSLTDDDLPTDEELEELYQENIGAYTAPEYRKVTALIIEAQDFQSVDSVTDEALRARYDETIDRYRTPSTRNISQLIFDSRDQAEAVRAQLEPGDDLSALAAKAGVPAPIDLGELTDSAPVATMMGDAYNLPVGQISEPTETDLGWHLFEVTSESVESTSSFEDVKEDIRDAMLAESGIDAVYEASVDVEDAIAGGTPLQEVSEIVGGRLVEIAAMDRNGQDPGGLEVSKIFDRANFINTVFSTPAGEASQLLDTPERSGYYVIQVDSITPPTPRPLEEVRRQVVSLWERQTRAAKASALTQDLLANITAASRLSDLAPSHENVSYAPLGPLTRFGEGAQVDHIVDSKRVSPALLQQLFSGKTGDVVSAPVSDGFVIARIKEINTPNPNGELVTVQRQIKTSVTNAMREDLADQVVKAFAVRYPVELNNDVIDQTVSLR